MKLSLLAFGFLLSVGAHAQDEDCTFNQEDQARIRSAVQTRFPGAAVEAKSSELRWSEADAVTTLGYGGCVDLGSVITDVRSGSAKRSEKEVIARAVALAERYWTPDLVSSGAVATDVLRKSLGKQKWRREIEADQVRYVFKDPTYSVLQITHRFADGQDTVKVEWVGNF